MHEYHIDCMVERLRPVLKNRDKATAILKRYWRTRIAIVWSAEDVHRAANERGVALTDREAITVLDTVLDEHKPQYGVRWEDLRNLIEERRLGRKLTKTEISLVGQDIITIQKT